MPKPLPDARPERDRRHLENSRPLPWDRTCSSPGWPIALDHLLAFLESSEGRERRRRAEDRRKLRDVLGSIVLALYAAYHSDEERWLAYSRRNDDYAPTFRRYLHPDASTRTATTVVDFLAAAGFADHRRGSYSRSGLGGHGYRSRVKARPALIDLLEREHCITPDTLGIAHWSEPVRLKAAAEYRGGPKSLIPYPDTADTWRMRTELREYADFLG